MNRDGYEKFYDKFGYVVAIIIMTIFFVMYCTVKIAEGPGW